MTLPISFFRPPICFSIGLQDLMTLFVYDASKSFCPVVRCKKMTELLF